MTIGVAITSEEDWYVAQDISSGVASQGKTVEDALANLKEAVLLYYEDKPAKAKSSQCFFTTLEIA